MQLRPRSPHAARGRGERLAVSGPAQGRLCAWCAQAPEPSQALTTHGLCRACLERVCSQLGVVPSSAPGSSPPEANAEDNEGIDAGMGATDDTDP